MREFEVSNLLIILSLTFIALASVLLFSNPFAQELPTGFAVANSSGNITVVVDDTISIVLLDSSIDFGNCTLNQSRGYSFFDSHKPNTSSSGCDNFMCSGIYNDTKDYLELENDGNVAVNITLQTNVTAGNVYLNQGSATNSYYQYRTENVGLGCDWTYGNQPFSYVNLSTANIDYQLCDNMSFDDVSGDSFEIYAGIWINATASLGGGATWTFTATSI